MAYLMVRRHWNDEVLPLASVRVSKARAGVLIGLAMGAGVHRPLGAESQHGDVWLEVESEQHDLISDPVVFPIAAAPAMLRTLSMDDDTIAHILSDDFANETCAHVRGLVAQALR